MTLATIKPETREIPLASIDEPKLPARSQMDDEKLHELAASISKIGLIHPLIVVPRADRFEVVAGHRRWHACRLAGHAMPRCDVYPDKGNALEAIKHAENRHREELNAADEAAYFHDLLKTQCGDDVDALCSLVGEKRSYVEGRLLLFQGDPAVYEALKDGKIKIGVAQQLNRCTDELHRRSLLHSAIYGGATVSVVSGWIQQWEALQRALSPQPGVQTPEVAPSPLTDVDPFACIVCGSSEHVHTIRHLPIHGHCDLAILRKLIRAYHGVDETALQMEPHRRG
jgi:ParB/RepB/Spo0J family partition protein